MKKWNSAGVSKDAGSPAGQSMLKEYYVKMGVSPEVCDYCGAVEEGLKDRFEEIDRTAQINQMKVLAAMQKNRLSEACFAPTTGYGYNDLGRETLEEERCGAYLLFDYHYTL